MKYPQPVSTATVNEISDWLIKRLEELDIEDPGVYSRLLLSLLHTPFKLNAIDLLELPQLKDVKKPYHLLNKSNEELKRLAAVQNLMEVSVEQNKSNIISLVDELHSKLRKIESSGEESALIGRNNLILSPATSVTSSSSKFYKNFKKIKRNHGAENPTKNYYLAFPALSSNKKAISSSSNSNNNKEIGTKKKENSDLRSLCWSGVMNNSSKESDTSSEGLLSGDVNKTPTKRCTNSKGKRFFYNDADVQYNLKHFDVSTFSHKKNLQAMKSVKKQKRQRSHFVSPKSKTNGNRNVDEDKVTADAGGGIGEVATVKLEQVKMNFPPSAVIWDMDFNGQWEMDRDLIGEFIQTQKTDAGGFKCFTDKSLLNNIKRNSMNKAAYAVAGGNGGNGGDGDGLIVDTKINPMNSYNDRCLDDEEDNILIKCLPMKLIDIHQLADDDDNYDDDIVKPINIKEAQSISSLKSKFDQNVKALWGDNGAQNNQETSSLASSFAGDTNSLSLFNFNSEYEQHKTQVIVPSQHDFTFKNVDVNNNISKISALTPSSIESKFIKSGTNLLMSIWSENALITEPESLICKEVSRIVFLFIFNNCSVHEKINTIIVVDQHPKSNNDLLGIAVTCTNPFDPLYKELMLQRTKVTSDMNFWQVQDDASQFNHSNEMSGFRRFLSLSASATSEIVCANYHPVNNPQLQQQTLQQHPTKLGNTQTISVSEPEDLMLSATTHFSPIKPTYRDGYTFFIDSNYDKIHYERSESGSYYWNSKRVMKYKVRKVQPNREMTYGRDMGFSNNYNDIDLDAMEMEAKEFTLKFLVSENDKGCQTDTKEILMTTSSCNRLVDFTEDYCKKKIYDEYFKSVNDTSKWRYYGNICGGLQVNTNSNNNNNMAINTNNDNCSYFSVNRNKSGQNSDNELYATAAGTANKTFSDILMSSNSSSSSICTITSHDTLAIDPFESWRRVETNTCDALNYNSSNNNINNCQHSLWEQCSLCTRNDHHDPYYGEKSIPANRLLKDELQLDGEEIMTVIQNLYITSDYCDDGEDEKEDTYNNYRTTQAYTDFMMMLDDSMEGGVHENKFYEQHQSQSMYGKGVIISPTANIFAAPQSDEQLLQLEKFDEITLARMQWPEMCGSVASGIKDAKHHDHQQAEKYFELFKLFQESMVKEPDDPNNNNNNNNSYYQQDEENRPKVGRKRRHSTCHSLMEQKSYSFHTQHEHQHQHEPLYTFQSDLAHDAGALIEENANFFLDAASKMLKIDLEKIILCNDNDNNQEIEDYDKDVNGANYYRNILQQQQALLKQMDLGRPLTR
ncbi:unnamed protein product [Diamesa serratosioi]